uniref:Large ribosomal subunit protein uL13c n=1 Tax=Yamadaella caenomyce TaxID=259029 RepID=A0A1G4NYX2_9FLOR|nr:Ribosomal protein L13 [Yamadaella caenomyce]SCW23858.1 Ribosomal protein L13 [Yamadaella caenomyce]
MNKTTYINNINQAKWYLIDAKGHKVGRLSTEVANIIRGKNLASFYPFQHNNAHVIIINAEQITVTGRKAQQKIYYRHSGRPGNLKKETFENLQQRLPHKILEHSIRLMLPKGPLGRKLFKQLKVYAGTDHPHQAQQPTHIYI